MSDDNNLNDLPELDLEYDETTTEKKGGNKKFIVIGAIMVAILVAVGAGGYFYIDHQKKVKKQKAAAKAAAMEMAEASAPAIDPMMEASTPVDAAPVLSSAPLGLVVESSGPLDTPVLTHKDGLSEPSKIVNNRQDALKTLPVIEPKSTEEKTIDSVKNDKKDDTILVVKKKVHKKHAVKSVRKSVKPISQPKQDIERQVDPDDERFDRIF